LHCIPQIPPQGSALGTKAHLPLSTTLYLVLMTTFTAVMKTEDDLERLVKPRQSK
jgi:hypothetical protein